MISKKYKRRISKITKSKKRVKPPVKNNTRKHNKRTPRRKYNKRATRRSYYKRTPRRRHKILSKNWLTSDKGRGVDSGNGDICSICHDALQEGEIFTSTSCPHQFHLHCIASWCSGKANCPCPLCKKNLVPNPNLDPIQDEIDEEGEVDEEDINELVNSLINTAFGSRPFIITQDSTPREVFDVMNAVLGLWNHYIRLHRNNANAIRDLRQIIGIIYDRVVRATPIGIGIFDNNGEVLPEITNTKSSVILGEFFNYVANIDFENINGVDIDSENNDNLVIADDVHVRINGPIEIPKFDDYDTTHRQITNV